MGPGSYTDVIRDLLPFRLDQETLANKTRKDTRPGLADRDNITDRGPLLTPRHTGPIQD